MYTKFWREFNFLIDTREESIGIANYHTDDRKLTKKTSKLFKHSDRIFSYSSREEGDREDERLEFVLDEHMRSFKE